MSEPLRALDQSPFEPGSLTAEDEDWLDLVRENVRASELTVRLGDAPVNEEADYIVSRDAAGRWTAGRYIGELSFRGRRLEIRPRLGELAIERLLAQVLHLVAVPRTSERQESHSFIAWLMAYVWCRAFDAASRHGPPAIRRSRRHEGLYVRGRLDISRTARLRGAGSVHVASVSSARDLDNDVSRVLVAAERVLSRHIGHEEWRTPRVDELIPRLHAAVGVRPRLPSKRALDRIRYSPITRPFKAAAELSWRLAQLEGFIASGEEGQAEGLLLDVAELWELYVLNCTRDAFPQLTVAHWTEEGDDAWLLRSRDHAGRGLGGLRPDVLVLDRGQTVAVLDAKYKRLADWWPERPQGVDRGDLYQLTSYVSRFGRDPDVIGALIYPRDPEQGQEDLASAEVFGPWTTQAGNEMRFARLALESDDAIAELQELVSRS